jgi:hypothetical protein
MRYTDASHTSHQVGSEYFMAITCSGEELGDELRSCVPCVTSMPAVQRSLFLNQP